MPARGRVLIKKPDTEETLPGGRIIIPEKSRELYAANQFQVVSLGDPERCDFPEDCGLEAHKFLSLKECVHPIDPRIKPGAWIVVRPRSLVDAGENQYLVRQTDVLAVFSLSNISGDSGLSESVRLTGEAEAVA